MCHRMNVPNKDNGINIIINTDTYQFYSSGVNISGAGVSVADYELPLWR